MSKVFALSILTVAATWTSIAQARSRDEDPVLVCYEDDQDPHGERWYHRVEISYDAGRLIGSVFIDDGQRERLIKQTGVIVRNAGHGYVTAYVGRQFKVLLDETGYEGWLEFSTANRSVQIPIVCL